MFPNWKMCVRRLYNSSSPASLKSCAYLILPLTQLKIPRSCVYIYCRGRGFAGGIKRLEHRGNYTPKSSSVSKSRLDRRLGVKMCHLYNPVIIEQP